LARLIQREQVAIVHVNEILDVYAGVAARVAGVPCVWHVRADLATVPRLRKALSKVVLELADKVVVVSRSVQRRVFQRREREKVFVMNDPGPDPSRFHTGITGSAIREELGIAREELVVGLIGKLVEVKGHAALLRAAPHVLRRFPHTCFLIVGGAVEGERNAEYASMLRGLPEELGIDGRVVFTGFRSDVPQIMAACDVITHCSIYPDPFPGVVLQGMALGKPVVASNLGGAKEQIQEGVSGLLVDPRDPWSLASAITSLLSSPGTRDALGKTAAEQVRTRFTPEIFLDNLTGLYRDLLEIDQ
jgi:glycosyltransferase involved in cell wall biosynthesis